MQHDEWDAKAREKDIRLSQFDRRKQELMRDGMSAEEADDQAYREISREIRGAPDATR
jgi:hypothetical protein